MRQIDPDGYTLCVVSPDTMSFNPLTIPNLPYNLEKDFTARHRHVSRGRRPDDAGRRRASIPSTSCAPRRWRSRASFDYGTLGERTTTDAFRQWLGEHWNTNFVAIPYRGRQRDHRRPPWQHHRRHQNRRRQHDPLLFAFFSNASPPRPDSPSPRPSASARSPAGPTFWGAVVPTGTPAPIVKRLHDELLAIFRGQKFTDFANQNFLDPAAGSTEDFAAFLKKDRQDAAVLVDKMGRADVGPRSRKAASRCHLTHEQISTIGHLG